MPRVNFKASDKDFDALPNGSHLMEVESVELTQTKSTQKPMLKVTHKVLSQIPEGCGTKMFDQFVLVPQSGWVLKNFLEASGVPHTAMPGTGKGEFDIDFDTSDCIGRKFIGRTEQETYQKKNRDGSPVLDENQKPVMGVRSNIKEYLKAA